MEIVQNVESVNPAENPQTAVGEDALADLIERAASDQGGSRPLMTPKDGTTKIGRPSRSDPRYKGKNKKLGGEEVAADPAAPPGPPPFDATGACKEFFKVASKVLVAKTGVADCALLPEEIDGLGSAWGAVANQYMPVVLAQYGPLILACSITGSVIMRLNVVAQNEIERRKAAQATEVKSEESVV